MSASRTFRVVESASAAVRLGAAASFLQPFQPDQPITLVGVTRGAADDLARAVAATKPATFGLERFSLTQLAARVARVALAGEGRTPITYLGAEAVAARAAFEATQLASLHYFAPVAGMPGFPRALARTLQELRLARLDAQSLAVLPRAGGDLADLLGRVEASFAASGSVNRADLFATAARIVRDRPIAGVVVLLDLALDHPAEVELVAAIVKGATHVIATIPGGDRQAAVAFASMGGVHEEPVDAESGDLGCLRQFLFNDARPPARELDGSLEFFSAPGEGRECVEIARRILREAAAGVRFDEMAILVRSPNSYVGLLEHALGRADVPVWFDRGTRRPHPAGRAFLALLTCAAEQLSASRFAEYLSLGQVPADGGAGPADQPFAPSTDDVFGRAAAPPADEMETGEEEGNEETVAGTEDERPIVAGTLRAPWRWEKLLVESAVIGQDAARWRRRLEGRARELALQLREARREGGDESGTVRGLELTHRQLRHLQAFALPVIEELASWPRQATWGEWLDRFEQLAPSVLRVPGHVLRVFADLRPMAGVGPIDLDEVRRVLGERLLTLESEPPARRFGRVFVGTPHQVRGRAFRVVFVPGLAERMFPQKPREDPLLLDDLRGALGPSLPMQKQRLVSERLLLQLAAGAASTRLYVSYPRIELSESRARVPSFYALDIMRAATGRLPDHELLEERARDVGNATLAWPAPHTPEDAIDDQEHDLAVLRTLLDEKNRDAVKGHAHYLLSLNESLRRSVIDRWAHGQSRWSPNDGLIRVTTRTQAALSAQRLTSRSYSLSALQKFSACPYQFVLAAIYRLQPLVLPESLQRMDPLTKGSIFHDIQARFFRALQKQGALPVRVATLDEALAVLDATVDEVAATEHEQLAPAVERVWTDEIAAMRRDLRSWLHHVAEDGEEWEPKYFELAFGPVPGERDASSLRDEVTLEGGIKLRGAIDLIEEHRQTKVLRVTDHKTGRKPDRIDRVIVGGGSVLQPVLYGMAVETALGSRVSQGRLFYCTAAGGFSKHEIPLNDVTRATGLEVLRVIERAVMTGFLAAAPTEEACGRCDFLPVCGPDVLRRVARKPQDRLLDLADLRSRP